MQKILVVDDDAHVRMLVTTTLAPVQCQILEARNGKEALAMAEAERPFLILLDATMPEPNGLAVCRQIKSNPLLASTTVVMLTARAQDAERQAGLAAGSDAYMTKPFSPMELLQLVERVMRDTQRR